MLPHVFFLVVSRLLCRHEGESVVRRLVSRYMSARGLGCCLAGRISSRLSACQPVKARSQELKYGRSRFDSTRRGWELSPQKRMRIEEQVEEHVLRNHQEQLQHFFVWVLAVGRSAFPWLLSAMVANAELIHRWSVDKL